MPTLRVVAPRRYARTVLDIVDDLTRSYRISAYYVSDSGSDSVVVHVLLYEGEDACNMCFEIDVAAFARNVRVQLKAA
jgi:hypothetical protein